MSDEIYFQWQNEFLLKTIYPLREMKLRDFLVFFREIELWRENENMKPAKFKSKKKTYEEKQTRVLKEMAQVYEEKEKYFCEGDATIAYQDKYGETKELDKVRNLHASFHPYWDGYGDDDRKKKIFVAQRAAVWEQYRKEVSDSIAKLDRRVKVVATDTRSAEELERLKTQVLPMVEDELQQLKDFLSACITREKGLSEVKKKRETLETDKKKKLQDITPLELRIRKLENELAVLQSLIKRLQKPPLLEDAKWRVLEKNRWISDEMLSKSKESAFVQFKSIRESVRGLIDTKMSVEVRLNYIGKRLGELQALKEKIDAKILSIKNSIKPSDSAGQNKNAQSLTMQLQDNNLLLLALLFEIDRLGDYIFAAEVKEGKVYEKDFLEKKKVEFQKNKDGIDELRTMLAGYYSEIEPIVDKLKVLSRNDVLVTFIPEKPVDIKQIVMDMAEEYRLSLEGKGHDELLEMIVKRFWDEPERYPLWLQYMVIHFSGMRYASAHGSWADPKELLVDLKASILMDEFRSMVSEADIDRCCEEKRIYYESPVDQLILPGEKSEKITAFKLHGDQDKINDFIEQLKSTNLYIRRKAWYELRQEEDHCEVDGMSSDDVLEKLRNCRDDGIIPKWMWSEIAQVVPEFRLDVDTESWESLNQDELKDKNSGQWDKYREIMNQWKSGDLTNWRSEHDQTGQLVVTRAVCNEVAEHIQHMRGHKGAAGLTQKPNWYRDVEGEYPKKFPYWDGPKPYFKRPESSQDFKEGASLLWLKFVNKRPSPWQIAQPLEVDGEELVSSEYLDKKRENSAWAYSIGNEITRRRISKDGKGNDVQYLRWLHEATVAEVAYTAEGPVVLTFETALPYEDRRRSTIGVFKRYPHNLTSDLGEEAYNPAYVGWVPEGDILDEERKGEIPVEQFKDMLNWNKILRKEFVSDRKLADYQKKYIRRRSDLPDESHKASGVAVVRPKKEMAPIPDGTKLYRTKSWGDFPLAEQASLSALAYVERNGERVRVGSNFNPLPLWSNSGDWSAIVNSLIIPREDIDRLIALQVADAMKVRNKMNWLVYGGHDVRPYWTGTKERDWQNAEEINWGTILFGHNLVLTDGDATFYTKLPNEKSPRNVSMKRLVCFRKRNWGVTHDTHPWLIQRATEVDNKDRLNVSPKGGVIYSPLWSPLDWPFYNGKPIKAFYIPTDWLIPCPPAVLTFDDR